MPAVTCPHCEHEADVAPDVLGRKILCGACNRRFTAEADGEEEPPARRSTGKGIFLGLGIVLGGAALIALVVWLVYFLAQPKAGSEGETWSHAELLAHLNAKGLGLMSRGADRGAAHGPAMYFMRGGDADRRAAVVDDLPIGLGHWWEDVVYVQKRQSAQEAKDRAAVLDGAFSWGRFLFAGDQNLIRAIRSRL